MAGAVSIVDEFVGPAGPLTGRAIPSGEWRDGTYWSGAPGESFTLTGAGALGSTGPALKGNDFVPNSVTSTASLTYWSGEIKLSWDGSELLDDLGFGTPYVAMMYVTHGPPESGFGPLDVIVSCENEFGLVSTMLTLPLTDAGEIAVRGEVQKEGNGLWYRVYVNDALAASSSFTAPAWPGDYPLIYAIVNKPQAGKSTFNIERVVMDFVDGPPERPPPFWTNFRRTHEIR